MRKDMISRIEQTQNVSVFFDGWKETLIWSCLQGIMGELYADDLEKPTAAMALLGDFCFFAGKPNKELVQYKPESCVQDFMIMVPQNEQWAELIESYYNEKAKKTVRYAIKKENDIFDKKKLIKVVEGLPQDYVLQMMDENLFWKCKEIGWCRDWVAQYPNYALYQKYGLGAIILKDNEPVSGASSYSGYIGGIEIEIDTKEEFRRKGLAYICGAKLILECIERGWYPSWDAQNKWSVALAEKLGYHFESEYLAYEIVGY